MTFLIMHDLDVVIILQEGEFPHHPFCHMFTWSVGPKHLATATCCSQTACVFEHEQITRQAAQAKDIVFYINGIALDNVTEFKYLGHNISADDWDDAAVSYNVKKATKAWYGMQCILSANGADPHTMARFYLAVVQAKLFFGSETWVLSECLLGQLKQFFMLDVLGQFHINPFDVTLMALGNTLLCILYWLIVVCHLSLHILRDIKQDFCIHMPNQ